MINFFKYNDPARILFLFILTLVVRLPFVFLSDDFFLPEAEWIMAAQKFWDGERLYIDYDTTLAPLFVWTYSLLSGLFGYYTNWGGIFATLLVFIQAVLFNNGLNRLDVMKDKTWVPALIYMLFTSFFPDFYLFSPQLLSLTFLLLSLLQLFHSLKLGNTDERVFYAGFYLGVAALFYQYAILFAVMILLAYLLYTSTIARRYIILSFAFLFPIIILFVYYFTVDSLRILVIDAVLGPFSIFKIEYISWKSFAIAASIPVLFLINSIWRLIRKENFVNFQVKCNISMVGWLISTILVILLSTNFTTHLLVFLAPAFSLFFGGVLLNYRRSIFAELKFVLFSACLIYVLYGNFDNLLNLEKYRTQKPENIKEKESILVLDENLKPYVGEKAATRFVSWRLSLYYFENIDRYQNIVLIQKELESSKPKKIYDPNGYWDQISSKIPSLRNKYELKQEQGTPVYIRSFNN